MADPYWERFCRPLAQRIVALIDEKAGSARAPADGATFILEERIEAKLGDGRYRVGGDALRAKGKASLAVGQRVHVLWKRGARALILTHQWRRAQGGAEHLIAGGLVEELWIAGAAGAKDVWFRNGTVAGALELRELLEADPEQVWWGTNDTAFLVRCGLTFHTFRFTRDLPGAALSEVPAADLVRSEHPWDAAPVLAHLGWTFTRKLSTPSYRQTSTRADELYAQTLDPMAILLHRLDTEVATAEPTLVRTVTGTHAATVALTEDLFIANRAAVATAMLDEEDRLVLGLRLNFGVVPAPAPAATPVAGLRGLSYSESTDDPGGTGQPEAYDGLHAGTLGGPQELVSGPWGRGSIAPDAPDPDWHAAVVNVTDGVVLWRSWLEAPEFSQVFASITAVGVVSTQDTTVDSDFSADTYSKHALSPNQGIVANINRTTAGGYPDLDLGTLEAFAMLELNMVDVDALAFLELDPLAGAVTEANVRYTFDAIAKNGTEEITSYWNGPPQETVTDFTSSVLKATIGGTNSYRAAMLDLTPLHFLPRTHDLILLARREDFAYSGGQTGAAVSVWRVNVETGAAVALQAWTAEATNFFDTSARVLAASSSYVLWLRTRPTSSSAAVWTVYLTHAVPGEDSKGQSVVLEVAGSRTTAPAAIAALLAENIQVLWPDATYAPVDEKLLQAWDEAGVPTLEKGAEWPVRADVPEDVTALADYPADAAPAPAPAAPPSWQLIDNPDLLAQYGLEDTRGG
jgi:hypothetical protein